MAMGSVISIMILLAILPGGYKAQKALCKRAWWCIKTPYNSAKKRLEAKKKIARKGVKAKAVKTAVVMVHRKKTH